MLLYTSVDDYLKTLNKEQKKAVLTTEGPVLVLAGAGAGKTKTIAHRIVHLVKSGVPPEKILALTFTNKATREMRERIYSLFQEVFVEKKQSLPFVSTFHSLSVFVLKEYYEILSLPRHIAIADRNDTVKIVKNALKKMNCDEKIYPPKMILSFISKEKAKGVFFDEKDIPSQDFSPHKNVLHRIAKEYTKTLRSHHLLDFDDLLLFLKKLLEENKEVRDVLKERWHYIHIDEYQDTNSVQYDIALLLGGERANLFCVGDIDQCVYTWRNATIENILHFEKEFPQSTLLRLEQNYRSTKTIITASNNLIEHNKNRKEKTLFTEKEKGEPLHIIVGYDEKDEARKVALILKEKIEKGEKPSEMCVLYRTNFQSRALEEACMKEGIPYKVLGTRFFDRQEIKDILSYVRFALMRDDVFSLRRALTMPKRGIGEKTIELFLEKGKDALPQKGKERMDSFFALCDSILEQKETTPLSDILLSLLHSSGIHTFLLSLQDEGKERLANIFELISLVKERYDGKENGMDLLLEEASLASDQDELDRRTEHSSLERVSLMTVHSAKGLEFSLVCITGMEEGLFPQNRIFSSEVDPEEERRLFYVALTRAKKEVYIFYAYTRSVFGQTHTQSPSSFLEEIGEECYEKEEIKEKGENIKTVYLD